jgi:pyruvate/2-oxoglutarate dehydrogenase complex dihydrolipoamide acyltransferase (E2) component
MIIQKPKPNRRTIASERARRRAKDIYIETLRASGGKPPSDQSIRDTLAREGHTPAPPSRNGAATTNGPRAARPEPSCLPTRQMPNCPSTISPSPWLRASGSIPS